MQNLYLKLKSFAASNNVSSFWCDRSGSLTITFVLVFFAFVSFLGSAVDYNRAITAKAAISSTVDAAALAGARKMVNDNASIDEVTATVSDIIAVNFSNSDASGATLNNLSVRTFPEQGEVQVEAEVSVPTAFTRLAGLTEIDVSVQAHANFMLNKDVELTMMLDLTGSMSGDKITDLQNASKDLIDILMPEDDHLRNKVRIGLVPYSEGVNAGDYAATATDGASTSCATERGGVEAFTDADYLGAPIGNGSEDCPQSIIVPLTDNRSILTASINGFTTGGYTAGQTGIAWSWYMLSPNWSTLWPTASQVVPYDDDAAVKVAILMTDGAFNTVYNYVPSQDGGHYEEDYDPTQSRSRARDLCEAMKTAGIRIYTVAFEVDSDSARRMMHDCASETKMYFNAANGEELRTAFRMIAGRISDLRLSK